MPNTPQSVFNTLNQADVNPHTIEFYVEAHRYSPAKGRTKSVTFPTGGQSFKDSLKALEFAEKLARGGHWDDVVLMRREVRIQRVSLRRSGIRALQAVRTGERR